MLPSPCGLSPSVGTGSEKVASTLSFGVIPARHLEDVRNTDAH